MHSAGELEPHYDFAEYPYRHQQNGVGERPGNGLLADLNIFACCGTNELVLLWSAASPSILVATAMIAKPTNTLMPAKIPCGAAVRVEGAETLCDSFGTCSDGCVSNFCAEQTFCVRISVRFWKRILPNIKAPSKFNQCHSHAHA